LQCFFKAPLTDTDKNNIILPLNEFQIVGVWNAGRINWIGSTGLNPSEFSGKPRKDEVLTTNHIK
jgi:hypothetical protein